MATSISPVLTAELEKFQADWIAVLEKVQALYFENHRRYWQGILTPVDLPTETAKTRVPDLKRKPTDQSESWEALFKGADMLPPEWPAQLQVDVYEGPKGHGWTVTLRAGEGGKVQQRTWNFGPENHRETGWLEAGVIAAPRRGIAMRMGEEEGVADALVGLARPWYVRLVLWFWRQMNKIRDRYVDLRGR